MNIAKTEAEESIKKIIEMDEGVPKYEVGFTNHSSSVTDFMQMLYEKLITGLWKDLRLTKTEESGKAMIHLQTIISNLIQRYVKALYGKFLAIIQEENVLWVETVCKQRT